MDQWEEFLPTTADSLPTLAVLDDRCRCSICKDYLQGPMITLCGHTFCSICIRRALNADGRCPICRSLEEESKLRKNLMIEEIVEAFLPFRNSLMQYAASDLAQKNIRNGKEVVEVDDSASDGARSESVNTPSPASSQTATLERPRRSTRKNATLSRDISSPDLKQDTIPLGHVLCPICQCAIHQDKADYHVNRCLEGKATPPRPSDQRNRQSNDSQSPYFHASPHADARVETVPSKRAPTPTTNGMKRLPKMSYAAMTDAKLRKTMAEMGINSSGNRAQLQRRCTEFIAMWNSNLDNKYPKSKKELISDMKAWDRVQARPVQRVTNEEIESAHTSGMYDDSFNDLIAKAKESLKKRKNVEPQQSKESVQTAEEDGHVAKRQHTDSM